jgi:alkylation response protein AidB-like acyl-CoA dehydrogenase
VSYSPDVNSDWPHLLKMSDQTTRAGSVVHDLLQAVDRIRPLITEHAGSAEANRQLSSVVYDAMYHAGLFAMLAPKAHGGLELRPVEAMRVWEAVARIDSAAAWNLVMNQAISAYAAWLPSEGAREVFRDGPATTAGAFNPPGTGTRADGGWRITGRLPFASGCHHAQWLSMPVVGTDGDRPLIDPATGQPKTFAAFFPRSAATIPDTWHTLGMRGTGSTDFAVQDLFVPDRMTAPIGPLQKPAPGFEGPLFRMWPWTAILGEATVSVGVAAAAVDAAVQLCKTKTPAYNAIPLREQQLAQFQMGKARARVEASRDTLYCAAEAAFDETSLSKTHLSSAAKIRLQLAVSFAAEACAEAVRYVNDVVGASSIRLGAPFERHFRDVHVLLQHSSKSSARYGSAGRLMFGLENDWVWLNF